MPFTGAHPMAVLPLIWRRRWLHLDPTCLVIGSMSPDFEYFLRGEIAGTFAHTLPGLVLFCVPITLAAAAVYHGLVKRPAVVVSPVRRHALVAPWRERWDAWAVGSVVTSAAVGATTHLVWDSFTHANGWGVEHFPVLHRVYDVPVLGPLTLHRILQTVCSVVGFVVVVGFAIRAIRRSPRLAGTPAWRWRLGFAGCIAVAVGVLIARLVHRNLTDPANLIVGLIAGTLTGAIVASVALRLDGRFRAALAEHTSVSEIG